MNFKTLIAVSLLLPLAGCASVKAVESGVKLRSVAECETLLCIQTLPTSEQIDEKQLANGLTQYSYRLQKRQGSYMRSFGYGLAAVFTLGISEVVANPVENAIQDDKHFAAVADCDDDGKCERLVLVEHNKPGIVVRGLTDAEILSQDNAKDTN